MGLRGVREAIEAAGAAEAGPLLAGLGVPDARGAAVAAGEEPAAVGGEGAAGDVELPVLEGVFVDAGGGVPQAGAVVTAGDEERLAVGRIAHAEEAALEARVRRLLRAAGHVPDADAAV